MNLNDDSREELEAEATILSQAREILASSRFRPGKHEETARQVRSAVAELLSKARHPSRNPQGF